MSVVFLFVDTTAVFSQKRYSQRFTAGRQLRLQLMNRTGTITVEGWNRAEVNVQADLEAPAANIAPQVINGMIVYNLIKDNHGRDVGSVNFRVRIPFNSEIDIETRIGNLSVSNMNGGLVRAHISSEGDITLTNIGSSAVSAENVMGDIFFDGQINDGGIYRFSSVRGVINIRIPFQSNFKLMATAPSTRSIDLGPFGGDGMKFFGDGRRVMGKHGSGSASITATNQRGTISFGSR